MQTIKINDQEWNLKQNNFRTLLLFEEMSGKQVSDMDNSVKDSLLFFYCLLKGSNYKTWNYSFDDFVDDIIDEKLLQEFINIITKKVDPDVKKK